MYIIKTTNSSGHATLLKEYTDTIAIEHTKNIVDLTIFCILKASQGLNLPSISNYYHSCLHGFRILFEPLPLLTRSSQQWMWYHVQQYTIG